MIKRYDYDIFFIRLFRGEDMLKRMINKKLIITSAALFALFLIYLVPKDTFYQVKDADSKVSYVDAEVNTEEIYLLNHKNMLGRTKIVWNKPSEDISTKAKFIVESLILDGPNSSSIPNGFRAIIPSDTKVNGVTYDNSVLKINFSKELLDIKEELEEKMIEAIVYSVTAIDGVDNVILYVDNKILTFLPKTKTSLPSTLNRSIGINKEYDFTKPNDINQVTVYYVDEWEGNQYYVPVTKYVNDDREKIKIIIDELTSTSSYHSNLMSYLNSNTEVLNVTTNDDIMELDFNSYIFQDSEDKNILEEVIYTISLSVQDNYDVSEVVFKVNEEEICKTVLKSIE